MSNDLDDKMKNFYRNSKKSGNWQLTNIAIMVVGFVIFFPLGLAVLAWLILGRNVDIVETFKGKYYEYAPMAKDKFNQMTSNSNYAQNDEFEAYKNRQKEAFNKKRDDEMDGLSEEERRFYEFAKSRKSEADKKAFDDFIKSQENKS